MTRCHDGVVKEQQVLVSTEHGLQGAIPTVQPPNQLVNQGIRS